MYILSALVYNANRKCMYCKIEILDVHGDRVVSCYRIVGKTARQNKIPHTIVSACSAANLDQVENKNLYQTVYIPSWQASWPAAF